jgi:CBS domain-containing protein
MYLLVNSLKGNYIMTKSTTPQYSKIFEVLQNAKAPVPVSTIRAIDGIVATRLSTYLWEIKKNTGYAVRANRDGRTVVSYELVGAGTAPVVKMIKAAAPKKAVKVSAVKSAKMMTAKKITPVPVIDEDSLDGIMNALVKSSGKKAISVFDEIDAEVEDFEDRQFAEEYSRS